MGHKIIKLNYLTKTLNFCYSQFHKNSSLKLSQSQTTSLSL